MNKNVSSIELAGHKRSKQEARECLAVGYDPVVRGESNQDLMIMLSSTTIGVLDRKVKHGQNLSYQEAFCGMCYVLAATNSHFRDAYASNFAQACGGALTRERAIALASAFLNLMAAKESFSRLTHEEIAGMVSAAMMDVVVSLKLGRVVETCGMGGDKGFGNNGTINKGINVSTLSSLVLAGLGLPTVKHGSYGNTSAVGSTESIELFGALTSMNSVGEVMRIWKGSGYCFLDAHWCKTIHDLSHLLMMETVNHIIGPMTPPLSSSTEIIKVMGVNEKVHPETVAKAYAMLHKLGRQNVGAAIITAGLDESASENLDPLNFDQVREHTILDELSPYSSVMSVTIGDYYVGSYVIRPADFGICIDPKRIQIVNQRSAIQEGNIAALKGKDPSLVDYLAMNASLGLYASEYLGRPDSISLEGPNEAYLKECFRRSKEAIISGRAWNALVKYVEVSGGEVSLG